MTTQKHRAASEARRRRLLPLPFLGPGVLFLIVFMAIPVVLLLVYSFFTRGRFGGVVFTFTTENFAKPRTRSTAMSSSSRSAWASWSPRSPCWIGYPIAYGITKIPARWRTIALIAVVLPFWTNFLVRTYAWILLLNNAGIVKAR